MDRKRILLYTLAFVAFAVLVYMQFRTWRHFDWATFWRESGNLGKPPHIYHLFHAVALIYLAYVMRAIRWKIFLRPVRPKASSWKLVAPTIIGFTGLALLGRPGELIRPYLIARREDLTFSSQLAVWAVERIFDIGAFTILLVLAAFFATAPKRLTYHRSFQEAGLIFLALSVGLDHRRDCGKSSRGSAGQLGRAQVCSCRGQSGSSGGPANSRISRRSAHHPRHLVVRHAGGGFGGHVGHHRRCL